MDEPSNEESLKNVAAAMQTPPPSGTAKTSKSSSYAKTMKELTRSFFKVSQTLPDNDPNFISMVLLDAKAAQLRSRTKNNQEASNILQSTAGITTSLAVIQTSKSASAFHAKLVQEFAPLQNDANQRLMQRDELEKAITTYINDLHSKFSVIDNEIKNGKSDKQVESQLDGLHKQWQSLSSQAEKQQINMAALANRLDGQHRDMYHLLTPQEQSKVMQPAGVKKPITQTQESPTLQDGTQGPD